MALCSSCGTENPEGQKFCGECGTKLGAPALGEERKVVTIVFCDLVMFTARAETLDPEDVRAFLVPYYDLVTSEITRHGGVVDKFLGDGVMAVFGAPVAHEDDPERAVRTALKILERIPALGLDLHARVGITTGEVMVVPDPAGRGDAITGDAANTASRLQALAPVDGVVVGEATYAATSHLFDYEVLAPAQVKGKAEPVPIYRPLAPIARPSSDLVPDTAPFVGRDFELESLVRLFDRSRTGPSTEFVTIVADPGIGKSRLVRELARHVESLPELVTWRQGRCLPYGDGISFWALGEIIKAHAGIYDTDDQATLSSKLDAVLVEPDESLRSWMRSRIAPLVGLETTAEPPQQEEAFTAWRRFLEQIAERGPTVLVVEDLHWADDALVAFLQHLAERTSGLPILVVTTARPEVEDRHPTWLGRARRSTVLPLAALPDRDMTTLVEATLEGASPELVATVLERAGGSPLYAEQLAAMLADRALPIAGGSLDESAIPPSVQALLAARIDALTPELKATLLDASVVGKTFWSGAVSALSEHGDLEADLAELARRDFIRPAFPSSMEGELEFSFVHALVRDVAYGELTKTQRARMHAAIARWIAGRTEEALGEDAEIVLHHLDAGRDLGSTEDLDDLLRTALVAAGRSAMRTDVARALAFHERALTMLADDHPVRVEVAHALGRALGARGRYAEAAQVLEPLVQSLLDADDLERAVHIGIDLDIFLWETGEAARGDALLRGLGDRLEGRVSPAAAELLAWEAQGASAERRFADAERLARRSIAIAEGLGIDPPGRALEALGLATRVDGDARGEALIRQASAAHLAEGHMRGAISTLSNLADLLMESSPERALAILDESIDLAEDVGVESEVWAGRVEKLEIEATLGRYDGVVEEAPPILAWAERHADAWIRMEALIALARVEIDRGGRSVEPAELAELVRVLGYRAMLTLCGLLALERGDDEGGSAWFGEAVPRLDTDVVFDATRLAVRLGEPDLVRDLVEHGTAKTPSRRASRVAASALLAEHDEDAELARDRYREAAVVFERMGRAPDRARALTGLGRCLLALGEPEEGVARLNEARELWVGMKAAPRIAEIDEALATVS